MKKRPAFIYLILVAMTYGVSCTTVDLYEKSVRIPDHAWQSNYKPAFEFQIRDSVPMYRVFMILRHTDRYNFNNIYVNLYIKGPGQDTAQKVQRELELGNNEKGWLGRGMDDIYEHRILLAEQNFKPGLYSFTLEQIMRENPLMNVLDAGIRVEKINP
ncbi:MAG: gliding motility lipoprotein GldH [Chitinophagaceae bacterium]